LCIGQASGELYPCPLTDNAMANTPPPLPPFCPPQVTTPAGFGPKRSIPLVPLRRGRTGPSSSTRTLWLARAAPPEGPQPDETIQEIHVHNRYGRCPTHSTVKDSSESQLKCSNENVAIISGDAVCDHLNTTVAWVLFFFFPAPQARQFGLEAHTIYSLLFQLNAFGHAEDSEKKPAPAQQARVLPTRSYLHVRM